MGTLKQKTVVDLKAMAKGLSHSRTDVDIRDLGYRSTSPPARGGSNLGPAPTEAALAALAGCTNVIGHKCAARLGCRSRPARYPKYLRVRPQGRHS